MEGYRDPREMPGKSAERGPPTSLAFHWPARLLQTWFSLLAAEQAVVDGDTLPGPQIPALPLSAGHSLSVPWTVVILSRPTLESTCDYFVYF